MIRRNSFRSGSVGPVQKVTVRLLDDSEIIEVDFQSHNKGQYLLDYVCRQLNIAEKDYFGLRYVDSTKQRHWMDLGKLITKQLKEVTPYIVCFRFKFYPGDPMLLKEEVTRYQLILQLRRDLLHGRLHSPSLLEIATLSSYIVQSELGDFDPDIHTANYVAEYELVARQTADLEDKVKELHLKLSGLTPAESDILFLKRAAQLDTYGIDPHPVKDQQGEQLFLGLNHAGISTFQGSRKLVHYKWSQITKLNYEAKMFIVHVVLSEESRNRKKETAGFKCQSSKACKYLWRCGVEQRLFFTCPSTQNIAAVRGGGLFGSRFRYSGKVQKEILEDPGPLRAVDGILQRTPLYRSLQRHKARSYSQSPMQLGYGSLPRSNHSAPGHDVRVDMGLGSLGSSASLPLSTLSTPFGAEQNLPLLETLEEDSSPTDDKGITLNSIKPEGTVVKTEAPIPRTSVNEQCKEESITSAATRSFALLVSNIIRRRRGGSVRVSGEKSRPGDLYLNSNGILSRGDNRDSDAISTSSSAVNSEAVTIQEKRRRFGISARQNFDIVENSVGAAWSKARKHLWRFRRRSKLAQSNDTLTSEVIVESEQVSDSVYTLVPDEPEDDTGRIETVSETTISKESTPEKHIEFITSFGSDSATTEVGIDEIMGYNGIDGLAIATKNIEELSPIPSPTSSTTPVTFTNNEGSGGKEGQILLSIWKIFIVCMLCVLVALLFVAIMAIEVDIDICQKMRKIPEVELFQTEVYEPMKYFIRDKIHNISEKINFTFQ